jgi:hypothetical protein
MLHIDQPDTDIHRQFIEELQRERIAFPSRLRHMYRGDSFTSRKMSDSRRTYARGRACVAPLS